MTAVDGPAHLLSLKVMRVSRPALASAWHPFYSSSPSFSTHSSASILSLQGSTPLPGHPKTLRDLTHASELLTLPASFGSIQLGETFSSCLCVNNEAQVEVEAIRLKVEMQTITAKVILAESESSGHLLLPGDTLESVVHHEIKELGQHVLACTVTYRLPPNSRPVPGASEDSSDPNLLTFRKFYKFAVTNPLSVKTKVHTPKSPSALLSPIERDKIFLEVHIQNLTQEPMYFERMRFECADGWEATDGNVVESTTDSNVDNGSIFSKSLAIMQPQDMRQYIYILTPKFITEAPAVHVSGSIIPLGRLDISWRSSFGEPGRLLTSMLSRRIPTVPIQQPASALPQYLKRTVVGPVLSRPQSPQHTQSRPSTPPPLMHRPGSPAHSRSVISGSVQPNSPSQSHTSTSNPQLEVDLIVRRIARNVITVEKPFSITFAVAMSSLMLPGKGGLRRIISLAVQHVQVPRIVAPNSPVTAARETEPFSPRLPSSGASTPSSTPAPFNYALAHQKLLVASSMPPVRDEIDAERDRIQETDHAAVILPPPFYEGPDELKHAHATDAGFVGSSVLFLPPVELSLEDNHEHSPSHAVDDSTENAPKHEAIQEFTLSFVALQKGFTTIGGLRLLLIEDKLSDEGEEDVSEKKVVPKRAQVLKEYNVVAEVWASA